MNPYIGEIRLVPFNFAPVGWHMCDGSLLPIFEFAVLYQLIGTIYGGDGTSTFGLPDLRGRVAMHMGAGFTMGQRPGEEGVTLTYATMPSHAHLLSVGGDVGTSVNPASHFPASAPDALGFVYGPYQSNDAETMDIRSVSESGGNQAHPNIQPYLALNYIICLEGVFPPQS